MKENTLDVLFYLFDNFSDYDESGQNREVLQGHLLDAGFPSGEISKAFDWLESLGDETEYGFVPSSSEAFRVFSPRERRWLNPECQGYLLYLTESGVLTDETREFIIDKILVLRDIDFDLDKLKWVVLMILLNNPDMEAEYTWMDDIAMSETPPVYH